MASTKLFELSSRAQIAVDETGDPEGSAIFFFHGWPASRLQGAGFCREARELGARIISPDRPGIGRSSFQASRKLLDWPAVVRELAAQLGLARFRVLAISGGGPYAFATAYALPECVEAVAIVSGAPPLPPEVDRAALMPVYRWLLAIHRRRPELLRRAFHVARPFAAIRPPRMLLPLLLQLVPRLDRGALRDAEVFAGCFECYREAWRGTGRGVASDAEVYAADWGFAPEEIRVPMRLWHGKADRSFSWRLVEALAARVPNCTTRFIEDEGHYSLPIRHRRAILEDLLRA